MKTKDYIQQFDTGENMVHVPAALTECERHICIFLHTLQAGGSQYAIDRLIPHLQSQNFGIWIVSFEDGIYRDIFLEKHGVVVTIQPTLAMNMAYRHFLQTAFSYVILNSCTGGCSTYFINTKVPVLWWIHEELSTFYSTCIDSLFHPFLLTDNFHFLSPWKRMVRQFEETFHLYIKQLPISIEDTFQADFVIEKPKQDPIRFLIPGSYSKRKNFLSVISVITKLSPDLLSHAEFIFVGYQEDDAIFDKVREASMLFPMIKVLKEVSHQELDSFNKISDCIIVPSILDIGPLTVAEALMNQKLCIVSNKTGISEYMNNMVNGFVYDGSSNEQLQQKIEYVISNFHQPALRDIEAKGRELFLHHFCDREMQNQIQAILDLDT